MARCELPFKVEVTSPCAESWETMTGTARLRHCDSCNKQVHNFRAMTPREIERTIIDSGGRICARVARREDGSIVTADSHARPAGLAAGFALAAALSASAANAQTANPPSGQAIVTGRALAPDGSHAPMPFIVGFYQSGKQIVGTVTDKSGSWTIALQPGSYDMHVVSILGGHLEVQDVQLHAGQQSFGDLKTNYYTVDTVSGGDIVVRTSPLYVFRHPIRYLTYLRRKYL